MSWEQYLQDLLDKKTELDDISISIDGSNYFPVPPIIKTSVLLADGFKKTGHYNTLIFPERQISSYLYMLLRTLFNIAEERIGQTYDPANFHVGQLLKYKNHVVRFIRFDPGYEGEPAKIRVEFADRVEWETKLARAPQFQLTTTNRGLTQYRKFKKDFGADLATISNMDKCSFLSKLSDFRTHLTSTSVYIAPIGQTRELLQDTWLNNSRASDILFFGQADYEGKIAAITAGQAAGLPALTIAPNLNAAVKMIGNDHSVHSIFVQADQKIVDSQLSDIDLIIEAGIPLTLLSDSSGLEKLQNLECRNFCFWTWDKSSLLSVFLETESPIATKVKNSIERTVEYLNFDCPLLDHTIRLLNEHRQIIEDTAPKLIPVRNYLYWTAFHNLRAISPVSDSLRIQSTLKRTFEILEQEERHISQDLYSALSEVIENISLLNSGGFSLPKTEAIRDLLSNEKYPLYVIVPIGSDKILIQQYLALPAGDRKEIHILYPDEYIAFDKPSDGLAIASGWYNRKTMHKIFQANIAPKILTMLYGIEQEWKELYVQLKDNQVKERRIHNSKLLNAIGIFDAHAVALTAQEVTIPEILDEVEAIELTLSKGRYGSYRTSDSQEVVDVIPVDYVGGLRTFFRTNSKVITVTGIVQEKREGIKEKDPKALRLDDFVVERTSSKDLIREIADKILENGGQGHRRDIAEMWKETLKIMERLSGRDIVYQNLKAAGCNKKRSTIRNWLEDESMISPKDPEDIRHIAKAAGDSILHEKFEEVATASTVVRQAHIKAGHYLSGKLKQILGEKLSSFNFGYVHDISHPIDLEIETFGSVKILRIIDIGPEMQVDLNLTNRLLSTDRDDFFGAF